MLQRWPGFIQDGHFAIGDMKMCRRYRLFARFDIDSYVYSAGESFVRVLRQLDSVVFVGTKTYGAMLRRGFMPDLRVRPDEALERAVKYIRTLSARMKQ